MGGRDPVFLDRGHGECSPKPEEGKDGEDDDDQSDNVDNLVHVPLLVVNRLRIVDDVFSAEIFFETSSKEHNSKT